MTAQQELIRALEAIPWFQMMTPEHFAKILTIAKICKFEANQVIFHEGDKEDFLYVVLEGRVAIEMSVPGHGRIRILTAEPMEEVGWSSVTPVVRQRTAGRAAPSCPVAWSLLMPRSCAGCATKTTTLVIL